MTERDVQRYIEEVVCRSGTSFYWAMRLLPKDQREAMFAIYAFSRDIDDIADEPGSKADKLKRLRDWRKEIRALYQGRPVNPIACALLKPVQRFGLEEKEFMELINGMEMDVKEEVSAPALKQLHLYCRRVAGAVGMLAIRVFGCADKEARTFAEALGEALQLTNILRDVSDDARIGRLYLPREVLAEAGIAETAPDKVVRHPALPKARAALAVLAEKRFAEAQAALARTDARRLRPAVVMMAVYRRILKKLGERGWAVLEPQVKLGKLQQLGIALRYGVWGNYTS